MNPINADWTAVLLLAAVVLMFGGIWLRRPDAPTRHDRIGCRVFDLGTLLAVGTLAYNAAAVAW